MFSSKSSVIRLLAGLSAVVVPVLAVGSDINVYWVRSYPLLWTMFEAPIDLRWGSEG